MPIEFDFQLLLYALLALGLYKVISFTYRIRSSSANVPPCPVKAFPFLGHLPYLTKDPRNAILEWSKRSSGMFSLYFGPRLVVVLSRYDLIKEALVKRASAFSDKPEHSMYPAVLPVVYGIIETSGPKWKENRSIVVSMLKYFGSGKNLMSEKVEEEIAYYQQELDCTDGKAADVTEVTNRAVSNIVCNFLLGRRFDYDDTEYKKLLGIYKRATETAGAGSLHMWFPWLQYIPGDFFGIGQMKKDDSDIVRFSQQFIKRAEQDETSGLNQESILFHYLQAMKEKEAEGQSTHLNYKNLEKVISDLLVAGSETATSTLLWFYLYMVHNPHVQKKIQTEIDQEVGTSRVPTLADKARLTYLNAAIMETQRISSIVPLGLFHRCTAETTLQGYTIPYDALILPHLDSVLLSDQIWGDPLNFRPERFLDDARNLSCPDEFIPFSLGRRHCLGEALAKIELFLFTAHVMQRYELVPENNDGSLPSLDSVMGVTSAPIPYKIRFIRRDT